MSSDFVMNPLRTANTTVQASRINGGNLAQSFNLQNLRIITGFILLNQYISDGDYYSLLRDSDNEPISLSSGDIIIGMCVKNVCKEPIVATDFEGRIILFDCLQIAFTTINSVSLSMENIPIEICLLSTFEINAGCNVRIIETVYTSASPKGTRIYIGAGVPVLGVTQYITFTSLGVRFPSIGITLFVLNPNFS
jgi:hypothetical protein